MPNAKPFGQALQHAGDAELVDHLGQLPGARRPHMADALGIGGHHRLGAGKAASRAAAHDGQLAVLGAGLAARNRGVDHIEPVRRAGLGEFAGDGGGDRGVVDEQAAGRHGGKGAIGAERHGAQVGIGADAGEHDLGIPGRLGRRCGAAAAVRRHPGGGLFGACGCRR